MEELRLVGVAEGGDHLLLAGEGGRSYTVAVDERLRAAANGHLVRLGRLTSGADLAITPKEIQSRIRSGQSADEVAASTGVDIDYVQRFVGPVLREREHIATQARDARIGSTGGPAPLLGDVVDSALARRGLSPQHAEWDAGKRADGTWQVWVRWGDGMEANWSLDVVRRQAAPLDETARSLAPGRDTVDVEDEVEHAPTPVTPFVPRLAPPHGSDTTTQPAGTNTSPSAKRPPAEAAPADEPEPHAESDDEGAARPPRRSSIPSWDDIVFGTKPKE